jgi:hypothetical protein
MHRGQILAAAFASGLTILGGAFLGAPLVSAQGTAPVPAAPAAGVSLKELRGPKTFEPISDARERSVALFAEAGKVITHPRCVNCHPATERPLQTDAQRPHLPRVVRGEAGLGSPGLACTSCHQADNIRLVGVSLKSMPGHPKWQLAPLEMAWEGQTLGAICSQIKDPARNGGKDLAALHEHMAHDSLVGWGWNPGEGREPAPGNQEVFGQLIQAWIDTGAHCP